MNFMQKALENAKKAFASNEVPIGAVIVKNNKIISEAYNMCEKNKNMTHHAEILAINKALSLIDDKSLNDCDMYVTVEPCAMCAGAISHAKIKRVYIGCEEPKTGCYGSVVNLNDYLQWKPEVYIGFCEDECRSLIKQFFTNIRKSPDK